MTKSLHVVSFDIPYPANYGGVIDVFYRLRALQEAGVEVILHCFEYGKRRPNSELEKFAKRIYYYPRRKLSWQFWLPYIVGTRNHPDLLNNLLLDESPILFEALHSSYYLNHPALSGRKKLVRMHNIEQDYYALMAGSEKKIWKKLYFLLESWLLKQYENKLNAASTILAISEKDCQDLQKRFGEKVQLLPPAHSHTVVTSRPGFGSFCFYHGKLSVAENHQAALFLVKEVFSKIEVPLILAGDIFSDELMEAAKENKQIQLLSDLSPAEIDRYIQEAHINVLPTFQSTGIKLKLVNVLYQGRFVAVNKPMVEGTGFEEATLIYETAEAMAVGIQGLMQQEFKQADKDKRITVLGDRLNVQKHVESLVRNLFTSR